MLVDDLRAVLRLAAGRPAEPAAAIIDSRTVNRLEKEARIGKAGTLAAHL